MHPGGSTRTTCTSPVDSIIPTHNSTFALDIARSAAIKHNMAAVFFSLEMGRNEITMRLLSAEAGSACRTCARAR